MPLATDSVKPKIASSGRVVVATGTMPASRMRAMSSASATAGFVLARLP